jgi:hypothetical protein
MAQVSFYDIGGSLPGQRQRIHRYIYRYILTHTHTHTHTYTHTHTHTVLPKLNDRLLNEMGITNVGVRIRLLNEIVKIQVIARSEWRNHVVWASEQYRPGPCNNTLTLGFPLCCLNDCILGKPDIYTLTNSKLNILASRARCKVLCVGCACCGREIRSNNVDLVLVHDIDTAASTNILGDPLGNVLVSTLSKEMYKLKLRTSECSHVTMLMSSTREEAVTNIRMYTMSR